MRNMIAALPMYDWPELRTQTDSFWARLGDAFRARGLDAPKKLSRHNTDLTPVPGGIRNASGEVIGTDPATLAPDNFDLSVLWRHPDLLLAQTCWGPMDLGLAGDVQVVGQSMYDGIEGGEGDCYSSAIVVRRQPTDHVPAPSNGRSLIPIDAMRGKRFTYNDTESMSGFNGLKRDLEAVGESFSLFATREESGAHRHSIRAIAEGKADIAAIDCFSWTLAKRFEPAAAELTVIGWTARRKGMPFITSRTTPPNVVAALKDGLAAEGTSVLALS